MGYDSDTDPYLDPVTGILRNKASITTQADLDAAEAELTASAILLLQEEPILGNFDPTHLQAVHEWLFEPLYDWAGELRTVDITKGDTKFANVEFLTQAVDGIFAELRQENLLDDLNEQEYIARLAHYYSEVNILHPFREGNGRTQRAFFTLLAARTNQIIAWDRMDIDENLQASIAAYNGDESRLIRLLAALIT